MTYIEFCAGAGGMRAGLAAADWQCLLAMDNDPDCVAMHSLAHGSAREVDVRKLISPDLPEADVWVAGFPCQPFSSSGNRLGFGHSSGNVFEHLARLIGERHPSALLLENVEGLLSNKAGHTFAAILRKLTDLGYIVDWLLMDLRWFGPPQTRPRLFIVAATGDSLDTPTLDYEPSSLPGLARPARNVFAPLLAAWGIECTKYSEGSVRQTEKRLRPSVGKPQPNGSMPFAALGRAAADEFATYEVFCSQKPEPIPKLASIVAPNFRYGECIRSGRFWTSHGGPTKLHLRREKTSHCIGTSLGGAPLFTTPVKTVANPSDRRAFLEFANWHREQDDFLVMRLTPQRAALLFGPYTESLYDAFGSWKAGDTRKYKLVGNMVAPICAKVVADIITRQTMKNLASRSLPRFPAIAPNIRVKSP
jgi:site-specific DNA-cytosine methylase